MFKHILRIALGVCVTGVSTASYSTTYPFENESVVPTAVRAETPSEQFDETDPGGYFYVYLFDDVVKEEDLPYCFAVSGALKYVYATQYMVPGGVLPSSFFNCTNDLNYIPSSTMYTGKIGTYDVCTKGECCPYMDGVLAGGNTEPDSDMEQNNFNIHQAGNCNDMFTEEVYCALFSAGASKTCIEQYISESERAVVYACYDGYFNYLNSCQLYAVTGFLKEGFETPTYIENCAPAENTAWFSLLEFSDKLCHPQSYYHPDMAKGETQSSSETGKSASLAEESSQQGTVIFGLLIVVAAFL